jgi:hypothetical protein
MVGTRFANYGRHEMDIDLHRTRRTCLDRFRIRRARARAALPPRRCERVVRGTVGAAIPTSTIIDTGTIDTGTIGFGRQAGVPAPTTALRRP